MGIISSLRYDNAGRIHDLAKQHKITGVTVGKDERGFYFATGVLPDFGSGKRYSVTEFIPQTELPSAPKPVELPSPATGDSKPVGKVAMVHAWLDENGKGMDRKSAIAALVALGINQSTAGVQYGAWSKKNAV